MLDFLPSFLSAKILSEFPNVCEVRVRADLPVNVICIFDGKIEKRALQNSLTASQIEDCVMKLCDYSIFSVEYALKSGYITSKEGERVGLCGECIRDSDGKVVGIKNFTSLCVRFPHAIEGCSDDFVRRYIKKLSSCLVFSPPFRGKTTFIRDLGRNYSEIFGADVLYLDERNEFALPGTALGKTYDVLKFTDKNFGFNVGVKTLNPDVIVCDEMSTREEFSAAAYCGLSGVKTIASTHSDCIENIKKLLINNMIFETFTFDYYVELNNFNVVGVYDSDLRAV